MKVSRLRPLFVCLIALVPALAAVACGGGESNEPPVATATVSLNHDRVPAGSPLELTYKFVVADDAKFDEDFRVFVHMVDADEEQMWTDDHNPPIPTSQWKPGQTVEYTRTIFVPVFPYVGDATIQIGLHSLKDQHRLTLSGEDLGQKAYNGGRMLLLPQTDNLFTVFKDGWHPAESSQDGAIEWQWTKKQATLAFKNPKKDAVFYFELDSPGKELHGPQQVQVVVGGQPVQQIAVTPDTDKTLHKIKLPGNLMGDAELSELQIVVDSTFVPNVVTGGASKDPRELGVRVFHAYVDPR